MTGKKRTAREPLWKCRKSRDDVKTAGDLQEFVLRWSSDGGSLFREIVRQQWNFSPPQTAREVEEYQVELSSVTILELSIVPNTSGGPARASLKSLQLS